MVDTIRLDISKSQAILLYLPCEKKDIVPTTDVFLKYWRGGNVEYDLFVNDFINEAVKQLYNLLTRAMNNELQLNKEFVDKGVGYYHNIYLHELFTTDNRDIYDPAEKIIVWSTPTEVGIETYIYNIDGEIYLEISPFYKWDSDYPDDEDEYQTFEEYINQHQMIDLIHIRRDVAVQWQKILHELIEIAHSNERYWIEKNK
ncbi:hypothetical protein LBW89_18405 [Paenibacillus sp. alder61]|uniref:Uncharacterized protein n=1 Tax=Paenibacillus faecis TaxID=862114 RepID=A0A5D0CPT9_9BACL|nr:MULTISPECIES: hypothetical protein [Paenibacillus]MCA1294988.1 hypothetical protein [Paenibacillus sp. alder61]TYA10747.1 hypothetical protein FRY98_23480 [Paenibacillus faecis]